VVGKRKLNYPVLTLRQNFRRAKEEFTHRRAKSQFQQSLKDIHSKIGTQATTEA